jgi:hypothetical protein
MRTFDHPIRKLFRLVRQPPSEFVSWTRGWFHALAGRDLRLSKNEPYYLSLHTSQLLTEWQGTEIATVLTTMSLKHFPQPRIPSDDTPSFTEMERLRFCAMRV